MSLRSCASCAMKFEPSSKRGSTRAYKQCNRCSYLKCQFGINARDYEALLDAQDGTCALCSQTCSTGKRLAIDHDHACCPGKKSCGQCIRGLLCFRCNCYLVGMYEKLPSSLQDWPRLNAYLGV